MPEAFRAEHMALLRRRFDHVETQLNGHEYLVADRFSVADAYLFTVARWASRIDLSLDLWPNLSAFVQRVGARPLVAQAVSREEG